MWRHQMEAFSSLLALCEGNSPATGKFPSQRPVTRSFGVFFDLRLNKRFCKQSRRRWFETPPRSLLRHCNVSIVLLTLKIRSEERGTSKITALPTSYWGKLYFIYSSHIQSWHITMASYGCDGVSNHQPHHCLLNRLFRRRSKKASKLRVTGLFVGNSPVTSEFPAQRASNAESVSIWWRHHDLDHNVEQLWREVKTLFLTFSFVSRGR